MPVPVVAYVVTLALVFYGVITFVGAPVVWFGKALFARVTKRPLIPLLTPFNGLVAALIGWGAMAQAWFALELDELPMLLLAIALVINLRQEADPALTYNARIINRSETWLILLWGIGNVVRWLVFGHEIRWV